MAQIKDFDHIGVTVVDLDPAVDEDQWLMAYVRGPEGIVVSLSERIG